MLNNGKRYSGTTFMVLCGLFAALCAVCSLITIPLGFTPVPVNLATLAVFITGGILGKKYGTLSLMVYVLLGAVGIPVFAGFRGGLGVLMGPTGGYIIGYIAATFVVGAMLEIYEKGKNSGKKCDDSSNGNAIRRRSGLPLCILSMVCGLLVCYALGTAWFIFSSGTAPGAALVSCVLPFLPGDAIKILLASILVKKLRPLLA